MLEPRRVAARAAAGFMAQQLGEAVGDTVGYRIRFESRVSARTRIEVVTEGILTRMLQDDPDSLRPRRGIGASLFDEFHERHLAGDLGLALALDVQAQLREDLRIVVMSATLDGERLARFLDAPRLTSAGRSFPVEIAHFPARRDEALEPQARRAIEHALATHPGDVLVFLPGQREIARLQRGAGRRRGARRRRAAAAWRTAGRAAVARAAARSARPPPRGAGDQRRRIQRDPARRARGDRQRPGARAALRPEHRVLAAGRGQHLAGLGRPARRPRRPRRRRLGVPAVAAVAAAGAAAAPRRSRRSNSRRWRWNSRPGAATHCASSIAPPAGAHGRRARPAAAARRARRRRRITALGRRMLALGTHPRLAAMLLAPREDGERALACDLAALVEARDPLRSRSDALAERWQALAAFRSGRAPADANRGALAAIDAAAKQWRRRLRCDAPPPPSGAGARARRPAGACLPRPHRAPARRRSAPLPAGQRPHGAAVRRQRAVRRTLARRQRTALRSEGRAGAARRAGRRGAPARAISRSASSSATSCAGTPARRALVAQREQRFDGIVLGTRARPAASIRRTRRAH